MPDTDPALVDTHALLWWQADSERLSATARTRIDSAAHLVISAITCWEIAMLAAKGRIALDRPLEIWVNDLLSDPTQIRATPVDPATALTAGQLEHFHGDPADRIIVATAKHAALPVITKDHRIHHYTHHDPTLHTIW